MKGKRFRKIKRTTNVRVPIGTTEGNITITLKDIPLYKFHRLGRVRITLYDLEEKLRELGIDTDEEIQLRVPPLTEDELNLARLVGKGDKVVVDQLKLVDIMKKAIKGYDASKQKFTRLD